MSNPWFRLYAEFAHDPKIQMLSEAMQRRYIMIMCMRCSNALVTLHETEIAFHLRVTDAELAETKALFISKGFIDEQWKLLNWDKRQFVSDSSADRVKRHRAKRSEQGLPQQNAIKSSVRYAVYERDGSACIYCGKKDDLTIDHDVPQSRGGSDEVSNLLTACRACNASKRDLTHDEYCERNGIVTLLKRKANAVDTEQIQITDTDKKPKSAPASPLPDWLPASSWKDYLETRKVMKAPMTERAKLLAIAKLSDLMRSGHDPTAVLDQSVYNGWKGLFPIKADSVKTQKGQSRHEQLADKLADLTGRRPSDPRVIHGTAERLD